MACTTAATVVPLLVARRNSVSPRCTEYATQPSGTPHGAGVADGAASAVAVGDDSTVGGPLSAVGVAVGGTLVSVGCGAPAAISEAASQ